MEKKKIINQNIDNIVYYGIDSTSYDKFGIQLKWNTKMQELESMKNTNLLLLKNFIKSEYEYIIILEDNILFHKKFNNYLNNIKEFANNNEFKLIYLSVNSSKIYNSENIIFNIINISEEKYKYVYGVVIHKSIINLLLYKYTSSLIYNIHIWKYISDIFPEKSYICNIPLVVDNNLLNDNIIIPRQILFFVLIDSNVQIIKRFIKLANNFIPYIKLIFVTTTDNIKYINKFSNYDKIIVENYDNNVVISCINKCYFSTQNVYEYFGLTNIYINWKLFTFDLFNMIKKLLTKYDIVSFEIHKCNRCYKKIVNINRCYNNNILNGLKFIKISYNWPFKNKIIYNILNSTILNNRIEFFNPFYDVNNCQEISDNTFHNVSKNDIEQDIINESYKININDWIIYFNKWYRQYIINKLIKLLNNNINVIDNDIYINKIYYNKINNNKSLIYNTHINNIKLIFNNTYSDIINEIFNTHTLDLINLNLIFQ